MPQDLCWVHEGLRGGDEEESVKEEKLAPRGENMTIYRTEDVTWYLPSTDHLTEIKLKKKREREREILEFLSWLSG